MKKDIRNPCLKCKHANPFSTGCKAFPKGIPYNISNGLIIHNKVLPNQIGEYVFEEGEPEVYKDLGL